VAPFHDALLPTAQRSANKFATPVFRVHRTIEQGSRGARAKLPRHGRRRDKMVLMPGPVEVARHARAVAVDLEQRAETVLLQPQSLLCHEEGF
jgi:hypothetical protein